MDVDGNPGFQRRQDLEEEDCRVAILKDTMGIIDEQQIAGLEQLKKCDIDVFEGLADHMIAEGVDLRSWRRVE